MKTIVLFIVMFLATLAVGQESREAAQKKALTSFLGRIWDYLAENPKATDEAVYAKISGSVGSSLFDNPDITNGRRKEIQEFCNWLRKLVVAGRAKPTFELRPANQGDKYYAPNSFVWAAPATGWTDLPKSAKEVRFTFHLDQPLDPNPRGETTEWLVFGISWQTILSDSSGLTAGFFVPRVGPKRQ